MCGRFTLAVPREQLIEHFGGLEAPDFFLPRYNIAPGQPVLLIPNTEARMIEAYHWGLVPFWATDKKIANKMINARAETVAEKPAFRQAFRRRRCVVLASGYYEWKKFEGAKVPMYIRRQDQQLIGFAGLWEEWAPKDADEDAEKHKSCTIITTEPCAAVRAIHHRMPAVLEATDYEKWLDPQPVEDRESLAKLLRPFDGAELEAYPVARIVNTPAVDGPECIERVAPPAQLDLF